MHAAFNPGYQLPLALMPTGHTPTPGPSVPSSSSSSSANISSDVYQKMLDTICRLEERLDEQTELVNSLMNTTSTEKAQAPANQRDSRLTVSNQSVMIPQITHPGTGCSSEHDAVTCRCIGEAKEPKRRVGRAAASSVAPQRANAHRQ